MDPLDCAVLAMRYPVGDDFAIALSAELYAQMLGNGQALTLAVQRAMTSSLSKGYHPGTPPLSVATPALFGRRAVDLQLQPPSSSPNFVIPPTGLAYFPDEPERFVGRVGQMAQASAAIAPRSEKTSVLFYGMAGAGKTACALELSYRYPDGNRFSGFVWHKAPDEGDDISTALANLALDLEKQLPGFAMVHLVDREDELNRFLPQLTALLAGQAILIVIDNLESLLTDAGVWRDARWERVIDAMVSHRGLSRLILTSRRLPNHSRHTRRSSHFPSTRFHAMRRYSWRESCRTSVRYYEARQG